MWSTGPPGAPLLKAVNNHEKDAVSMPAFPQGHLRSPAPLALPQVFFLTRRRHCPGLRFLHKEPLVGSTPYVCARLFSWLVRLCFKFSLFCRSYSGGTFSTGGSDEEIHFYIRNHVAVLGSRINQVQVTQVTDGALQGGS